MCLDSRAAAEKNLRIGCHPQEARWLIVQSLPEQVRNPLPPWDTVAAGSFFLFLIGAGPEV